MLRHIFQLTCESYTPWRLFSWYVAKIDITLAFRKLSNFIKVYITAKLLLTRILHGKTFNTFRATACLWSDIWESNTTYLLLYHTTTYIFVVPALNFKRSIYYGSGKIWHLGNSVLFCCYIILKFYYTSLKVMQYMYSFLVLLLTTLLYMLHNTEKKLHLCDALAPATS